MSIGLLWLPTAEALDPRPPRSMSAWCARQRVQLYTMLEVGSSFDLIMRVANQDNLLLVPVDAAQESWLTALLAYGRTDLLVLGPAEHACRGYRNGHLIDAEVILAAHGNPDLPPVQSRSAALESRFFGQARRNGHAAELQVLDPRPASTGPSTPWIALEGADGAGKTSQARHLAHLTQAPIRRSCRSGDFYAEVSRLLQATVLEGDSRGWRWGRLWKIFDSMRLLWAEFQTAGDQLRIWDRYLPTHLAACFMRFQDDAGFAPWLATAPQCRKSLYLDLPESESARRRQGRCEPPTLDEHPIAQRGYRKAFRALAQRGTLQEVNAASSETQIQLQILAEIGLPLQEEIGPTRIADLNPAAVVFQQGPSPTSILLDASQSADDLPASPDPAPGMWWRGFLQAIQAAGATLSLTDRMDLLALELERRLHTQPDHCHGQELLFPLWPPLLRAVHGCAPGFTPPSLLSTPSIPWTWKPTETIHPCWRPFFRTDAALEAYRLAVVEALEQSNKAQRVVAGALLFNAEGHLLLERRHPAKALYPGFWDSPGGKVEVGESAAQACAREMQEEYGLSLPVSALGSLGVVPDRDPVHGGSILHHLFRIDVANLPTTCGPDAVEIGHFSIAEARRLPGLAAPLQKVFRDLTWTPCTQNLLSHVS
ncbi:MAG: NUDIX domain-containing protein [Planctomycetota bacterium]